MKDGAKPDRAGAVVPDADSYQRLPDALDGAEAVAGIRGGLESVGRGEGRPASDGLAQMRKRLKIPRAP